MSNAACTDSFTPSILCSPVTAMYRAAAPKPASAAAWPTGRQIAAIAGQHPRERLRHDVGELPLPDAERGHAGHHAEPDAE